MNTQNSQEIHGSTESIFRLAARVEDWPSILPHYRSVTVLSGDDNDRTVRMKCVRKFGPFSWPCSWSARQQILSDGQTIHFEHVAGPAKGMKVQWKLVQHGGSVLTTITHELKHPLGPVYSNLILARCFIGPIANQTLMTIKRIVENRERN